MPLYVEELPEGSLLIRCYPHDVDPIVEFERRGEYFASCVLTLVDGVARVEGLVSNGRRAVRRSDIYDVLQVARDLGAYEMRITRAPGHVMPMALQDGDDWVIWLASRHTFRKHIYALVTHVNIYANRRGGRVMNFILRSKLFGNNETFSAAIGKAHVTCRLCRLICRALNFLHPKHCEKAVKKHERK